MKFARTLCVGLALGAALTIGSNARAEFVEFVTIGTFTGGDLPPGDTYLDAANGISIVFNSSLDNTVDAPPSSQVSFGQFDTSGTTATSLEGVSAAFSLQIFQSTQGGGVLEFLGTLSGSLQVLNSQAFVQFDGPLTGNIGLVIYTIVSADDGIAGRVNIAPPRTNNGLTTISGRVNVIPEPSSVVMLSLGCVGLLTLGGLGRRKQLRNAA